MELWKPSREGLNERIIEADAQKIFYGIATNACLAIIAGAIRDGIVNSDAENAAIASVAGAALGIVFGLLTAANVVDGNEAKNSALEAGLQVKRPFPFVIRHIVEPEALQHNHNSIAPQ